MSNLMNIVKTKSFKRISTLFIVFLFLYFMKSMIYLMLLTFIFVYMINNISKFLIEKAKNVVKINYKLMVVIIALLLTSFLFFVLIDFLPLVIHELMQVIDQIHQIYSDAEGNKIVDIIKDRLDGIYNTIFSATGINYIMESITNIGRMGINIVISLILSVLFLLEKDVVLNFTNKFGESKIAGFYNEIKYFGVKFISSFGKVIQVQILIAAINGVLSMIGLSIIGFPHLLGFGVMVMLLGLIPVAGVIISIVPLSIVGFNTGGLFYVLYILVMICILHFFEAYILNPKLMSSKTKIPIFYTLVILVVSEKVAGILGLIIGIPVFMFILDIIELPYENSNHKISTSK